MRPGDNALSMRGNIAVKKLVAGGARSCSPKVCSQHHKVNGVPPAQTTAPVYRGDSKISRYSMLFSGKSSESRRRADAPTQGHSSVPCCQARAPISPSRGHRFHYVMGPLRSPSNPPLPPPTRHLSPPAPSLVPRPSSFSSRPPAGSPSLSPYQRTHASLDL